MNHADLGLITTKQFRPKFSASGIVPSTPANRSKRSEYPAILQL